ncbi:MAG: hypothetical protein Kow0090_17640 [Myxococcota bacterium]
MKMADKLQNLSQTDPKLSYTRVNSSTKDALLLSLSFRHRELIRIPLDKAPLSIGNSETSDIFIPDMNIADFEVRAKSDGECAIVSAKYSPPQGSSGAVQLTERPLKCGEAHLLGDLKIKIDQKTLFSRRERSNVSSKRNTLRILPQTKSIESVGAVVKWLSGGKSKSKLITSDGLRIGKAEDNDLVLSSNYVSAHHCILTLWGGGVKVYDLHSTNGTWIGANRIYEGFIGESENVRVGDVQLVVEISTEKGIKPPAEPIPGFIAESSIMREVVSLVRRLAPYDETVLLLGETGTGKELLARALHHYSPSRSKGKFVAVNCASIPAELAESELFGHEKGAFTGADKPFPGAFRSAEKGTILLDEIAELPLKLQPKLLRALETRRITPVGSNREMPVNARIIAATHRNLGKMVEEGTFRQDLYHRLMVLPVEIPPLRERKEDIEPLAAHFIKSISERHTLSKAAERKLAGYDFPGNVRELKHTLIRAVLMSNGTTIEERDITFTRGERIKQNKREERVLDKKEQKRIGGEDEREELVRALKDGKGDPAKVCAALNISRATLFRRLKKQGLNLGAFED